MKCRNAGPSGILSIWYRSKIFIKKHYRCQNHPGIEKETPHSSIFWSGPGLRLQYSWRNTDAGDSFLGADAQLWLLTTTPPTPTSHPLTLICPAPPAHHTSHALSPPPALPFLPTSPANSSHPHWSPTLFPQAPPSLTDCPAHSSHHPAHSSQQSQPLLPCNRFLSSYHSPLSPAH